MTDRPIMNVSFHISKQYLHYTYVPIKSILVNNSDYCVHVYLVSNSFDEEDLDEFYRLAEPFGAEIFIVRVPELLYLENERTKLEAVLAKYMFFILPDHIDKALIFDADIVVKASLKELYETDMGDCCAVCSDCACIDKYQTNNYRHYFAKMGSSIFTSPVVLYDLRKIRSEISLEDVEAAARKVETMFGRLDAELICGTVFKNRIKYVPEEKYGLWLQGAVEMNDSDEEIENIIKECVVAHYVQASPWNPGINFSPLQKVWWEYAKDSPYYEEYLEQFWGSWRNLRKTKIKNRYTGLAGSLCKDFDYYFSIFKNKRIVLYGAGEKTRVIIDKMQQYEIVGVLDPDEYNIGMLVENVPVLSMDETNKVADMIIISTVVSLWNEIFHRIKDDVDSRIPIFNLHGEDMRKFTGGGRRKQEPDSCIPDNLLLRMEK